MYFYDELNDKVVIESDVLLFIDKMFVYLWGFLIMKINLSLYGKIIKYYMVLYIVNIYNYGYWLIII